MKIIDEKKMHPSYAMLKLQKVSHGKKTALFGSSIQHSDTIELSISEGKQERSLSRDWFVDGKEYVKVEMSYSQFAEMITSFNQGCGVPVTLRRLHGETVEKCPYVDKRVQFEGELDETIKGAMSAVSNAISAVKELFETKKTFSKADKDLVLGLLFQISRSYDDYAPFLYKQFNEQMEKTVTEAKAEFESFIQNKINNIAMTAISERSQELTSLEAPVSID
jgi:hypothetical protein